MQNGSYNYRSSGGANRNVPPNGQQNRPASGQPTQNRPTQQRPAQGQQRPAQGQHPVQGQQGSTQTQRSAQSQQVPRPQPQRSMTAPTRVPAQAPARAPSRNVPAARKKKKKGSFWGYWMRAFSVDQTVLEQRDLVREQGSYDYVFLIIVLVLLAFGTIMVYSSSYAYSMNKYNDSYYIIFRQFIFIVVGFFGMGFAMWFRPEWYKRFALVIYIICFLVLALVPIIGVEHKGAKRWISLGFTEVQPSEFMKLGLVLLLAWYFDRYYERITDYKHFWRSSFFGVFFPILMIGVTCVLVIIEKHLSGTIIMFLIGIIVIFAGGAMIRWLVGFGTVGMVGLFLVSIFTDYTKRRIDIWQHPEAYPQDGGWQTLQGLYAIGSGGFFGVGLGESRQKHMYVSEPQNDYIFTIVCEELGFLGAVAVILLFAAFVWRGFQIAMKAPDTFSSLVVMGIVGKVAVQSALNIAVVTNSIPPTGISLPFFSYGGSSLVILMIEMGIVLSISRFSKQQK